MPAVLFLPESEDVWERQEGYTLVVEKDDSRIRLSYEPNGKNNQYWKDIQLFITFRKWQLYIAAAFGKHQGTKGWHMWKSFGREMTQ